MEKLIEDFIKKTQNKDHLAIFYKNTELSVNIKSEEELNTIVFTNGSIILSNHPLLGHPEINISGSRKSIILILTGEEKLRAAIKKGGVSVISSFRNLLFLESLFILAKSNEA